MHGSKNSIFNGIIKLDLRKELSMKYCQELFMKYCQDSSYFDYYVTKSNILKLKSDRNQILMVGNMTNRNLKD